MPDVLFDVSDRLIIPYNDQATIERWLADYWQAINDDGIPLLTTPPILMPFLLPVVIFCDRWYRCIATQPY